LVTEGKYDDEVNRYICLSPSIINTRPGGVDYSLMTNKEKTERHNKFSYAVGNLISATPALAHLILVGSTADRLVSLARMIKSATKEIKVQLSQTSQDVMYEKSGRDMVQLVLNLDSDEYDESQENLSPPLEWREMSLDQVQLEGEEEDLLVDEENDDEVMQ